LKKKEGSNTFPPRQEKEGKTEKLPAPTRKRKKNVHTRPGGEVKKEKVKINYLPTGWGDGKVYVPLPGECTIPISEGKKKHPYGKMGGKGGSKTNATQGNAFVLPYGQGKADFQSSLGTSREGRKRWNLSKEGATGYFVSSSLLGDGSDLSAPCWKKNQQTAPVV